MNGEASTEDKQFWCKAAESDERAFAVNRLFQLGLAGSVNVEKRTNPYTHDLFVQWPVDLKNVSTPLFKAQELYGIDPQYAVTFNDCRGQCGGARVRGIGPAPLLRAVSALRSPPVAAV